MNPIYMDTSSALQRVMTMLIYLQGRSPYIYIHTHTHCNIRGGNMRTPISYKCRWSMFYTSAATSSAPDVNNILITEKKNHRAKPDEAL